MYTEQTPEEEADKILTFLKSLEKDEQLQLLAFLEGFRLGYYSKRKGGQVYDI